MRAHPASRTTPRILTAALTCALATATAGAFAAPASAPASHLQHRELDPQIASIAAPTGRALVRDMHAELGHLKAHDIPLATAEITRDLNLASSLQALLPYTSVVDHVASQQSQVSGESVEDFHRQLAPIYGEIDEMRVYAPKTAAQARHHLDQAGNAMKAGNKQQAGKALHLVAEDITTRAAYLPVGTVRADLQAAQHALAENKPDVRGARQDIEKALGSVRTFVQEVRLTRAS